VGAVIKGVATCSLNGPAAAVEGTTRVLLCRRLRSKAPSPIYSAVKEVYATLIVNELLVVDINVFSWLTNSYYLV
jgi:hypothetical protein